MALPSCRSNLHNSLFAVAASPPRCSLLRYQRLLLRYRKKQNGVRCSADRRELFTRIAPVYDNLNDLLSLGQHRIWKKMCVSWSGAKEGDIVLDICCGSGDLTFLLSQKVGSNGEVPYPSF
ncbi:hypothetical protein IEQ34_010097 [Dendrobium chrysotoxum]|uniref:2-phytyl-1,4-beta-naphthoquinone methyltransferase, chloroplastic n=1 Tax=Dendrobium chrysotoxum TaxID=161865 RepID=A0AAV7H0W3_DENCH|nr:hypothetical protein IEQ34_010097 [Dendrobium chrysotoxum]